MPCTSLLLFPHVLPDLWGSGPHFLFFFFLFLSTSRERGSFPVFLPCFLFLARRFAESRCPWRVLVWVSGATWADGVARKGKASTADSNAARPGGCHPLDPLDRVPRFVRVFWLVSRFIVFRPRIAWFATGPVLSVTSVASVTKLCRSFRGLGYERDWYATPDTRCERVKKSQAGRCDIVQQAVCIMPLWLVPRCATADMQRTCLDGLELGFIAASPTVLVSGVTYRNGRGFLLLLPLLHN